VWNDPPVPDFDAYLARLGVARRPPSLDALFELQRAHVERIPYETLWIAHGEVRTIDPAESIEAIVRGHGGYCFQLNGALSALLAWLGYDVTLHAGSVHGADGPSLERLHNHLVLLVHGFPTDVNPSGTWHVDAGLGDALHEPIPLVAGTYTQGALTFVLAPSPHPDFDWHWQHDPRGSFAGMSFRRAEASLADFEPMHTWLSTSADSVFVNNLILMRRDATGSTGIANLLLTETDGNGARRRVIEDRDEWHDLVRHRFLRSTADASDAAIDRMWAMLMARLEAFRAAHPSATPLTGDAAL
jgi:N-hydroxyarylamine O-acetyltransferase